MTVQKVIVFFCSNSGSKQGTDCKNQFIQARELNIYIHQSAELRKCFSQGSSEKQKQQDLWRLRGSMICHLQGGDPEATVILIHPGYKGQRARRTDVVNPSLRIGEDETRCSSASRQAESKKGQSSFLSLLFCLGC